MKSAQALDYTCIFMEELFIHFVSDVHNADHSVRREVLNENEKNNSTADDSLTSVDCTNPCLCERVRRKQPFRGGFCHTLQAL